MKFKLIFVLIVSILSCKGTPKKVTCNLNQLEELQRKLQIEYTENPQKATETLREIISVQKCGQVDFHRLGQSYLNMGSVFDEKISNLDSAIFYLNKALDIYELHDESLEVANINKYAGLLKAKRGSKLGLQDIDEAIKIYTDLDHLDGLYVSYSNKLRAQIFLNDTTGVGKLFDTCLRYWDLKNNVVRLNILVKIQFQYCLDNTDCDCYKRLKERVRSIENLIEINNLEIENRQFLEDCLS